MDDPTQTGSDAPAVETEGRSASSATVGDPAADTFDSAEATQADDSRPKDATARKAGPSYAGYEVLGELGRGGMGVVYLARQVLLNRPCALKVILAGAHAGAVAAVRFLAEAEAIARLQHPNVVQIHHIGEADGLPFVELEYVEGGSLDRVLDGTPWAPVRAAGLVAALADGVAEAHRMGLVHRDLKPGNVLLAADGTPKVTDFGLAKSLDGGSGVTATESILGSPSYMAPEQAEGKAREVGPAADTYALGAILYELLTGRPPFRGASILETLEQVRTAEPAAPSKLVPGLPRDVETIALTCLRKDPARRYGSASELGEDLRRFLDGRPIAARPVGPAERSWRWCRRNPVLAGLIGLVLALLAASAVGTTWAAFHFRGQLAEIRRVERRRHEALARSVLTALPDAVPVIVDELRSARGEALPLLRRTLDEGGADPSRRLRAAVVLTMLGEDRSSYMLEQVPTAPASECRNALLALAATGRSCVEPLRAGFEAGGPVEVRARYAASLLSFGEADPARSMLALDADPFDRAAFIHHFAEWHGDLTELPKLIEATDDPHFRSGLVAALGRIDLERLKEPEQRALIPFLQSWFLQALDGGTHSAADWTLRRWGIEPPIIARLIEPPTLAPTRDAPARCRWSVNELGMTLIEVPGGAFPGRDVLMLPFRLSDREVTAEQFRRFLDDPEAERPGQPPAIAAERPGEPIMTASWEDAALFCNWLSRLEGRRPCYERTDDPSRPWHCRFDADGYRLPTLLEWEYATRAGSATSRPVGDSLVYLADYAFVEGDGPAVVGSRMPNGWGLFDLQGNAWEFLWETLEDTPAGAIHPIGEGAGRKRRAMGGSFDGGSYMTGYFARPAADLSFRQGGRGSNGFRVVLGGGPNHDQLPRLVACATRLHPDDPAPQRYLEEAYWAAGSEALREEIGRTLDDPEARRVFALLQDRSRARATADSYRDGDRLAAQGRWASALAAYRRATDAGRAPFEASGLGDLHTHAWQAQGELHLALGDRAGYEALCRRLLDRITRAPEEFRDGTDFERAAKTLALAPLRDPNDMADLRPMARRAMLLDGVQTNEFFTLGIIEYRVGRHEDALGLMGTYVGRTGDPSNKVAALSVQAMALAGLGRREDARSHLEAAHRLMAGTIPPIDSADIGPLWWSYLIDHLLAREAEAVVLLDPAFPDDPFAH